MDTGPFAGCTWHNPPPTHRIDGATLHALAAYLEYLQ